MIKRIHIALTDQKKVLCLARASDLPGLVQEDEMVIRDWFYNIPRGLESFLKQNPNEEKFFIKAFAYWVLCKTVPGMEENQNQYGLLKRKLSEFSKQLFRQLRNLAARIALQVRGEFFKEFV